jgi:TPR repeat protein
MSCKLTFIGLGLVALVTAAGTWRLHASRVQSPVVGTEIVLGFAAPSPVPQAANTGRHFSQPVSAVDPREARRKATDYRQLVNLLLPLANSGSAAAQYELASALHYCDENWHAHFFSRSTGAERTSEEMRQLYMKLSENTQNLLEEAYQHCHSFDGDFNQLKTSSDWLDQAAKAGYPSAIFMKADLVLQTHLVDGDSAALQQARQLAIVASTSADPTVLFGMADFVDGTGKSREQAAQLISAWWLLGCESGYDCSAESSAIKGICTVDAQCANKPTVVEEIQRTNGANFGQVQLLTEQIRAAIESQDPNEIKKYL